MFNNNAQLQCWKNEDKKKKIWKASRWSAAWIFELDFPRNCDLHKKILRLLPIFPRYDRHNG